MASATSYSPSDYLLSIANIVSKYKKRTYELMRIQPGDKVLDVGCGPATDTISLASIVGETGQVVGVDIDKEQIMQATQKTLDAGVNKWVSHYLADGHCLSLNSDYFDSVRSERVFQHSTNPHQLLQEMIRVTKPGGWALVFDTDWSTMSFDTSLIDIEQKFKKFHVEKATKNGYIGRQLYGIFRQSMLEDIYVELAPSFILDYQISRQITWFDETEKFALEAGIVSPIELEKMHADLERSDAEGKFFAAILQIIVVGRKPLG